MSLDDKNFQTTLLRVIYVTDKFNHVRYATDVQSVKNSVILFGLL